MATSSQPKPACLALLISSLLLLVFPSVSASESTLFPESGGLREGFSNPETATPDTYRDPYAPGFGFNDWTGTNSDFRIHLHQYWHNIRRVHPFLNNDEELADLRFRQKHARPLFAPYDLDDMTHDFDGPFPVFKVDMETSKFAEWLGSITPSTELELVFTARDRVLIAQRIAYLESLQPTAAELESRRRLEPLRVVVFWCVSAFFATFGPLGFLLVLLPLSISAMFALKSHRTNTGLRIR